MKVQLSLFFINPIYCLFAFTLAPAWFLFIITSFLSSVSFCLLVIIQSFCIDCFWSTGKFSASSWNYSLPRLNVWRADTLSDLLYSPSLQHEDSSSSGSAGRLELGYLEEERVRVLGRIDELKTRLMELEQQLQESKQEVQKYRKWMPDGILFDFCWFLFRLWWSPLVKSYNSRYQEAAGILLH